MRKPFGVLLGGLILLQAAACSPFFIVRAGYEEAKILSRRQPIERLIADARVPAEQRAKLQLVLEARDFAADSLKLNAGRSYTTFSQLDSDTLALVLSAARPDRFEPYTWWFPIVGRVPYRAYFTQASAERAVESMRSRGYDTYVRPTAAFSTLGWFNDPLVSTLLRYDTLALANTVIHEIVHNTIFIPGQVIFNESFANFAGARGAIAFFCSRDPQGELCRSAEAAWRDELRFGAFLTDLVDELEGLYARQDLSTDAKVAAREVIFERARVSFRGEVQPGFEILTYENFARVPLNNASLISRRIYFKRLDLFEQVFQHSGGELLLALQRIMAAAEEQPRDPYGAVERLLTPFGDT
jgi:predicted aminopeptidase